jgi:hypothetical protein
VESLTKQDVIVIILKTAYKKRDCEQIYSKLQVQLTMSQFMEYIFELMKYDLLKLTGSQASCVITPKGMQYLRIHDELTSQMQSETARNSHIFEYYNPVSKLASFFKKKNNILENT